MALRSFFSTLVLICMASLSLAQDSSFVKNVVRKSIDLKQGGRSWVLLLKNHNTFLLHLAPYEKMVVKVFDANHNEVASVKQLFDVVTERNLGESGICGFFEIAGIPTLFIRQKMDNQECLFRIRFNPDNGTLLDEKMLYTGTFNKRYRFWVRKSESSDDYAVLVCGPRVLNEETVLPLTIFNSSHKKISSAKFCIPQSGYDRYDVRGMHFDTENGICLAAQYGHLIPNKKFDAYLLAAYAMPGDTSFLYNTLTLEDQNPIGSAIFSFNKFDKSAINLALSYQTYSYEELYALAVETRRTPQSHYITFDAATMKPRSIRYLDHHLSTAYIKKNLDSSDRCHGYVKAVNFNSYGMANFFCEKYGQNPKEHIGGHVNKAGICMTTVDENGEEVAGLVIPKPYYYVDEEEFNFCSFIAIPQKNTNYVIFNDYQSNFERSSSEPLETVADHRFADAVCYRIGRGGQLSKQYLFEKPTKDTDHSLVVHSVAGIEKGSNYACLLNTRNGKTNTLEIAWFDLP